MLSVNIDVQGQLYILLKHVSRPDDSQLLIEPKTTSFHLHVADALEKANRRVPVPTRV